MFYCFLYLETLVVRLWYAELLERAQMEREAAGVWPGSVAEPERWP